MLEEVIISCFLMYKPACEYLDKLDVQDFLNTNNQKIISIMKDLKSQGVGIDYVTVANKLPFSELTIDKLPALDTIRYDPSKVGEYIKQLKLQAATRNVNKALSKAKYDITDGVPIKEVAKKTADLLESVEFLDENKLVDVGMIDPTRYGSREKIKSGFSNLDKMIGGFSMGELSIWTGKSRSTVSLLSFLNLC